MGGIFASADPHKSKKKKKKEEKPEKKSKKKKDKKRKDEDEVLVVEKETAVSKKEDTNDINFWLGSEQSNGNNGVAVEEPAAVAAAVDKEHKKKKDKKDKKAKKDKKEKKEKKSKENGTKESYDLISVEGAFSSYRLLAESKDLKMFYELRKVPLDPDKLAAAVQVYTIVVRYACNL